MATLFNLKRNSRVFFTTNVSATTGAVQTSGFTAANTQELTVLDGFTFTQTTTASTISVNEAGSTPSRGERSFNTALNPVDFSFSTYLRPNVSPTTTVDADEADLWNALFGVTPITTAVIPLAYTVLTSAVIDANGILTVIGTGMPTLTVGQIYTFKGAIGLLANKYNSAIQVTAVNGTSGFTAQYLTNPGAATITSNIPATGLSSFSLTSWNTNVAVAADTGVTAMYSEVTPSKSNVNQLLAFGMLIVVDGISYTIDNCALDQASIDFGLDAIATIAWTGKGTQLNQLATNVLMSATTGGPTTPVLTFTGGVTGISAGKSDTTVTRYITNKLSTVGLQANIGGGGNTYVMALTGGSIQIANNINYITPSNIGVLNVPVGYYTGTRAITGTLNAYLKTGGGTVKTTGDLLKDILALSIAGATELKYQLSLAIGGSVAATRIEALINGASLQIPTVDASQDVVSTAIQFTAQGTDATLSASANYDVSAVNDIRIRYFAA